MYIFKCTLIQMRKMFLVKFENQQAGQQNDQLVENLVQRKEGLIQTRKL